MPRLAEMIGHGGLATLLKRLLSADRLSHAVLLEGTPGCGRRFLAGAVAQALLCGQPEQGDACGSCTSCQMVTSRTHPDLVETGHDADGGELGAEEVRDHVAARAYESPLAGHRRIFLLYGVERLREAAANAMLKALEEPPAGAYFVMTTAQAGAVLKTIRSRAQLFRMQTLTEDELARILIRGGVAPEDARSRAMRGAGSHRGLWGDLEAIPLDDLRSLCLSGYRAELVSRVVSSLPATLTASQEEAGRTLLGEQRRVVRQWLIALAHDLGRHLRERSDAVLAGRIERILSLSHDLDSNLQPRLVIEAVALAVERRR